MEARGCARTVVLALVLYVAVIVSPATAYASGLTKYSEFDAGGKIEIIGEPRSGFPFEVVFTFMPSDSFSHTRGISDQAYIASDSGVEFLSGDTIWTGFLKTGQEYVLRARYVVNTEIRFTFSGIVETKQLLGRILPPQSGPNKGVDFGILAQSVTRSSSVDFRSEEKRRNVQMIPILLVTDSGVVQKGTTMMSPPPQAMRRPEIVWVADSEMIAGNGLGADTLRSTTMDDIRREHIRKLRLPIKLDSSMPDTIRITYDQGREYVFVTDSSVDLVEVELLQGRATFKRTDHKQGAFELEADSAFFQISAGELARVLLVKQR